jgi:hypothetical protein
MYRYIFSTTIHTQKREKNSVDCSKLHVKRNPIGVDLALWDCLPKTHKELDGYLDGYVGFEWKAFNVF